MPILDGTHVTDGVLRIDLPPSPSGRADSAAPTEMPCFVAGPENRLPILALEQLLTGEAEFTPPTWTNPLVLIGPSGCGKSALAHAIVRRWLPVLGSEQVAYFTAIDFARLLSDARTDGEIVDLRSRLAKLQLLVIEDLHKLPAKLALHHELRDLLDKLAETEAVVICTSQESPTVQAELDPGLRDRFAGGLLLWFNHPGVEARLELLRLAAIERGTPVDERQLRTLAEKTTGPVPQLLRALRELDVSSIVGTAVGDHRPGLTDKEIIAVVARYFGVTQAALRGPARRKSLVFARSVAVYLLRTLTDASYAQIGKELGKRDHTTIMHAMESLQLGIATDTATQHAVEELRRIVLAA